MTNFKVESKNIANIDKKPRVYFTCHPDDFERYFRKIRDDIFKTHDCAIYYTEDMTESIPDDEKEVDLGRNNLFVVPVTFKLLSKSNRAMDEDIPYALRQHIPVLPIMMESGIDTFYSKPDKFGELQYLNPYSNDLTERSYAEKLKKYLESVLISDEMAKRVRAAFDAYIFLSYRKKDRKYANELMRLIHSNPECRDIAIWFDEFLTPGESFKESIEKILDDCQLFTLLVTPQLLEKVVDEQGVERDNYVISTELPLARHKKEEKGIDIFAVEMETTNRDALSRIHIEDYVNVSDEMFRSRLLEAILKIVTTKTDTPEHNFLIGLAYLDGIDVEVNHERGIELITSAAESGFLGAMLQLLNMYRNGIGTNVDYHQANKWAKRIADYHTERNGASHPDTLTALNNLAITYNYLGDYRNAWELLERIYHLKCRLGKKYHPDTFITLNNLVSTYNNLGPYPDALELNEKAYHLECQTLGEDHPSTLIAMHNLAFTFVNLGDYQKACVFFEKIYRLQHRIQGEDHQYTLAALNNLAFTYTKLGNYQKALELCKKAYHLRYKTLSKYHPDTLIVLNNLALLYLDLGNYSTALALSKRIYHLQDRTLGEEHPDTLTTLNNLAAAYSGIGNHKKALKLKKRVYHLHCRIWSENHPNTLRALSNLSSTYYDLGDYKKSVELFEWLYQMQCKTLSEDNPDTLTTLHNLAATYGKLGNLEKAKPLLEKVYCLQCRVLSEDNPSTLVTLHNLAFIYGELNNHRKALELYEKVYYLRCKVLGDTNFETLMAFSDLAFSYNTIGDLKTALPLYEKLCEQLSTAYGENHPKTLENLGRLEEVRKRQN